MRGIKRTIAGTDGTNGTDGTTGTDGTDGTDGTTGTEKSRMSRMSRMSRVPEGWKMVKLGEVCARVCSGGTPKSTCSEYYDEGIIPWLNTKEVHSNRIYDTEKKITLKGLENSSAKWIAANSIVVAMYGATAGNVAQTKIPLTTNQACCNLEMNSSIACSDFIFYSLRSCYSELLLLANGAAQQNLNAQVIKDFPIPLPPLPTQRKIAAVLGAIDNKIENNRKICANLEAQAQALFKSWFVDFEPFGGKMPEGWKEVALSEIADFYGGYSYKGAELQDSDCAMATIKNFERGSGFKLNGFKEIVPSNKLRSSHEVDLFDSLVAHTDLTQKAEVIGNAEMLLSKAGYDKIIMSMDLVKVLPKRGVSKFLLGALLKNPVFKAHCLRYVNGTTVLHLSKSALNTYTLFFPDDISVLNRFAEVNESICRELAMLIEQSRALSSLRDALLPRLMSGEIDVSEVAV